MAIAVLVAGVNQSLLARLGWVYRWVDGILGLVFPRVFVVTDLLSVLFRLSFGAVGHGRDDCSYEYSVHMAVESLTVWSYLIKVVSSELAV